MKWTNRLLQLADVPAGWSKDPSTKVGAVIADDKHRIVGIGYNGFPRDTRDDALMYADRDRKLPRIIHAEVNAVLNSNKPVDGCTIYVTHPPCMACSAVIIQSGIRKIVSRPPSKDFLARWGDQYDLMKEFVKEAKVEYFEQKQAPEEGTVLDWEPPQSGYPVAGTATPRAG